MGLGKTAQICAFLQMVADSAFYRAPSVVIVPVVTVASWLRELQRWAPRLKVVKLHGSAAERNRQLGHHDIRSGDFDVLVTTYGILRSEKSFFTQRLVWRCVVVDEAHTIKNESAAITQVCRKLRTIFRVAMTGTPIQNNTQELWCLLSYLYDDLIVENPEASVQDLARLVQHVMMRRTKADVASDLPTKRVEEILLESTPEQQELSRVICEHGLLNKNLGHTHVHLRKIACHPLLVDLLDAGGDEGEEDSGKNAAVTENRETAQARLQHAVGTDQPLDEALLVGCSAKMLRLDALLTNLRSDGHRVVIFSTFRAMLDVLEVYCELRHLPFVRLDGTVPVARREVDMHRFNSPQSSLFLYLVTTTAGGVGITLTGADTLILFDPHYNPFVDAQAIDRVHRIGQTRPVTIFRFGVQDSVETSILNVASKKTDFATTVMKEKSKVATLTHNLTLNDLENWVAHLSRRKQSCEGGGMHPRVGTWVSRLLGRQSRAERDSNSSRCTQRKVLQHDGFCFHCDESATDPDDLLCTSCTKKYHRDCLDLQDKKIRGSFVCPRHSCTACGRTYNSAGGVIFMCFGCPTSYCLDDLDPKYYTEGPTQVPEEAKVRESYPEQEADGMPIRKNIMYILCDACRGVKDHDSTEESMDEESPRERAEDAADDDMKTQSYNSSESEEDDDDSINTLTFS